MDGAAAHVGSGCAGVFYKGAVVVVVHVIQYAALGYHYQRALGTILLRAGAGSQGTAFVAYLYGAVQVAYGHVGGIAVFGMRGRTAFTG